MSKRIFISSTCYDLIDLRAELKEFILQKGMTPVMSDHSETDFETFQDKNSIETCLINLRTCDVVIVILSQRYGPSLKNCGFEDYSATHLEYQEAVKANIKTIVFARDRLEADFNFYEKSQSLKDLGWIKEKDLRIFEIIRNHKPLANDDRNNWYWTFKNSLDLKERLKVDLKTEIDSSRLNELIQSGQCPLLGVTSFGHLIPNSQNCYLTVRVENLGAQVAIEPAIILFKARDYKQVLDEGMIQSPTNYSLKTIKSLKPGEIGENYFEFLFTNEERQNKTTAVVEVLYRTIYGDLISDISIVDIYVENPNKMDKLRCFSRYTSKYYRTGGAYEQVAENLIKK